MTGAGGHSQFHGNALKDLHARDPGRIALAAVCDLSRERAEAYAEAYGFARTHTRIEDLLAREEPDGVVADLLLAPVAGRCQESYELYGDDFCIRAQFESAAVQIWDQGRMALT